MVDAKSPDKCIVCDAEGTQVCKQCKAAHYCSRKCQRNDWPTHKLICEAYSKFDISSRPTEHHFLFLVLPVDSKQPQIIWAECDYNPYYERHSILNVDHLLGPDCYTTFDYIMNNTILQRRLSNTIHIRCRDKFLSDGSKPNPSVAAIQATRAGSYHDWRGPVVANVRLGSTLDPPLCKDFDMADFRHLADHFRSYRSKTIPESVIKNSPHPIIDFNAMSRCQAVRINCRGDQEVMGRPAFEAINIRSTDTIFARHDTSDIADRIGIPIFTSKLTPEPKWKDDATISDSFENQDATFLHLCCDPEGELDTGAGKGKFGWAAMQWQLDVGSVIVVRQDKKPLWPWHVEALCKYIREDLFPYFEHSQGGVNEDEPMDKELVLKFICKPGFEIRWNKLLDEKEEKGEIFDGPHPYHV